MLRLRLTPAATDDLESIAKYTLERFGTKQAVIYEEGLLKAIALLQENPLLGSEQSKILPNTRRLVHESHSIYYEVGKAEILILRFLGPGEDPLKQRPK